MATTNNGFYVPQGLKFGDGTTQTTAYGNANVVTLLTNYGSNSISTTGNIDAAFFHGNGSTLQGLKWANITGANANVTALLAAFGANPISTTGTINAGSITGTTITASNVDGFHGEAGNLSNVQWTSIASADLNVKNYLESNATINLTVGTGDYLSQGNVTVSYADGFHGEGGNISNIQWANIPGANAIVANVLSSGSNIANISATGNVDSGNVSAVGNVDSGNVNTGNVSTTGNVDSSNVNSNVVSLGAGNLLLNGNNIYSTGDITIDPQYTAAVGEYGNVYIAGNLHVQNTLTYIDTTVSVINALEYIAADGVPTYAAANGAGLVIGNAGVNVGVVTSWVYSDPANAWTTNVNISLAGNVSAGNVFSSYLHGDGSNITNINASSLVGAYSNGNVATYLADFGSNVISTTGNVTATAFIGNGALLSSVTGGNVTGIVPNASHVTSATQANITQVGILTGVSTSGSITASGTVSAVGNISTAASINAPTGTVVGGVVQANSVAFGNLVSNVGKTTTQVYNLVVAAGATGTITLNNVKAVDYSWVVESTDDDSVSMGKAFVVANSADASITNYSLAQVGSNVVLGIEVDSASNYAAVTLGIVSNTLPFNANVVITTTQFA